jgi:hypothetical protein
MSDPTTPLPFQPMLCFRMGSPYRPMDGVPFAMGPVLTSDWVVRVSRIVRRNGYGSSAAIMLSEMKRP